MLGEKIDGQITENRSFYASETCIVIISCCFKDTGNIFHFRIVFFIVCTKEE